MVTIISPAKIKRNIQVSYLKPEINSNVKVYKVPVIKVNGEIIGDYDATQIAYQKGVGFIEENGATRRENWIFKR